MQVTFQNLFSEVPSAKEENSRLYVTTTEYKDQQVLQEAAKSKVGAAKVVLFTSGFFGLNLASVRGTASECEERVEYLINVDNCPTLGYFWERVKPIVVANDRMETIKKVTELLSNEKEKLFPQDCSHCTNEKATHYQTTLKKEIEEGTSWLSSDTRCRRIQTIFQENKFAYVCADLNDENAMQGIAQALQNGSLALDSIYLSNVREYSERIQKLELFQRAMEHLKPVSTPETLVVDTEVRNIGTGSSEKQKQQLRKGFTSASLKEFFPPSPKVDVQRNGFPNFPPFGSIEIVIIAPSDLSQLFGFILRGDTE